MSSKSAALLAAVTLLVSFAPDVDAADKVWRVSGGRPISAEVVKDHYDEVSYKSAGLSQTMDGFKVRTIDYGDAPDSYEMALDKLAEGEFENAASLMKAAMSESGVRDWIQVHGNFQLGEIHRRWGASERSKYAAAVRHYDDALKADDKTRLRPDILHGRALSHLGAGDVDKGLADLDTLAQEAFSNKYGVRWELIAVRDKATALDEAGRANDAKREYSKLEKNARSFAGNDAIDAGDREFAAEMAGLARLSQGRVFIRDDKARDAERFFDNIVNDDKEVEGVRAAALVGKGEALAAQNKLKEAQFAYATVRVHHYSAEAARAEATYRLGLVAEALGSQEPKGSQKAQDYFLEVVQRYPSSRWAAKAQEKLR